MSFENNINPVDQTIENNRNKNLFKRAVITILAGGVALSAFKAGELKEGSSLEDSEDGEKIEFVDLHAGTTFDKKMPLIGSVSSVDFERDQEGNPTNFEKLKMTGVHGVQETFNLESKEITEILLRTEAYEGGDLKIYIERISDTEMSVLLNNINDLEIDSVELAKYNTASDTLIYNLVDLDNKVWSPKVKKLDAE